nr:MAG TPA: hypothetical protein [Caudoviricetes sp.]
MKTVNAEIANTVPSLIEEGVTTKKCLRQSNTSARIGYLTNMI